MTRQNRPFPSSQLTHEHGTSATRRALAVVKSVTIHSISSSSKWTDFKVSANALAGENKIAVAGVSGCAGCFRG